jgi:hypothetical protein
MSLICFYCILLELWGSASAFHELLSQVLLFEHPFVQPQLPIHCKFGALIIQNDHPTLLSIRLSTVDSQSMPGFCPSTITRDYLLINHFQIKRYRGCRPISDNYITSRPLCYPITLPFIVHQPRWPTRLAPSRTQA